MCVWKSITCEGFPAWSEMCAGMPYFLVRARWGEDTQMRGYQPIVGSRQLKKIDIPKPPSDFHINL